MITRILASLLVFAGALAAQDPAAAVAQKPAYQHKQLYPLNTCVVSGEELGPDAACFEVGGRTFKTCSEKCKAKVEKAPDEFAKKLDAAIVKAQLPNYPLATCVISGKKLGSMGEPVQLVLDGTLVQLCCGGCTKKATAKAGEMAQKVRDAAFTAQSKAYPLEECVVSGEKLDDDAVAVLFGTQLVKFCCDKCVTKFEKDPAAFLPKLKAKSAAVPADAAVPGKPGKPGKAGMAGAMAGDCCDTTPAKPVEKTKGDNAAAGCGCCEGGCAGDAEAKPIEKTEKSAGKPGGGCCEQGAPAAKPKEDAKPKK